MGTEGIEFRLFHRGEVGASLSKIRVGVQVAMANDFRGAAAYEAKSDGFVWLCVSGLFACAT